ncbi:MAG: serine/threonine-protein kinase, partial [Planctomycetota bacterium]
MTNTSGSQVAIQRLGGYRILRELGRGGMGSVYLAKQLSLDRSVALKTIQTEWASNPRVIARFIREAYAAAQLTHHNVVQIYDLGEDTGTNFFSMELVGGGSLDDLIKKSGKLDPKTAACFIAQAARGLKFAHDNGMIHRDIKPANLMLTSDGIVKVADMGLVKTPQHSDEETSSGEDRNILLASARSQVTGQG